MNKFREVKICENCRRFLVFDCGFWTTFSLEDACTSEGLHSPVGVEVSDEIQVRANSLRRYI